ncbi:hypothetical protein Dd703_2939 [Musicola paradisiaca Ech703]|uniref:Uncharacterized protein n=1 Tax=Musicola paradisiaca (strain Ech703) TaxID=579405 RepID=C6CBV4_MUSP7|nr:hypothetical protein Dd703_2939 [Musicola paradisiaca Ech703]
MMKHAVTDKVKEQKVLIIVMFFILMTGNLNLLQVSGCRNAFQ